MSDPLDFAIANARRALTVGEMWLAHIGVKYDPDQPRDENGRWTDGGGAGWQSLEKLGLTPGESTRAFQDYGKYKDVPVRVAFPDTPGGRKGAIAEARDNAIIIWGKTLEETGDLEEYTKTAYEKKWFSSPGVNHILDHEYAHWRGDKENPKYKYADGRAKKIEGFRNIASEVSYYASYSGKEFLSETYAGLSYGNKYSDSVMNTYSALGGLLP